MPLLGCARAVGGRTSSELHAMHFGEDPAHPRAPSHAAQLSLCIAASRPRKKLKSGKKVDSRVPFTFLILMNSEPNKNL
jgi:hypothetical protein